MDTNADATGFLEALRLDVGAVFAGLLGSGSVLLVFRREAVLRDGYSMFVIDPGSQGYLIWSPLDPQPEMLSVPDLMGGVVLAGFSEFQSSAVLRRLRTVTASRSADIVRLLGTPSLDRGERGALIDPLPDDGDEDLVSREDAEAVEFTGIPDSMGLRILLYSDGVLRLIVRDPERRGRQALDLFAEDGPDRLHIPELEGWISSPSDRNVTGLSTLGRWVHGELLSSCPVLKQLLLPRREFEGDKLILTSSNIRELIPGLMERDLLVPLTGLSLSRLEDGPDNTVVASFIGEQGGGRIYIAERSRDKARSVQERRAGPLVVGPLESEEEGVDPGSDWDRTALDKMISFFCYCFRRQVSPDLQVLGRFGRLQKTVKHGCSSVKDLSDDSRDVIAENAFFMDLFSHQALGSFEAANTLVDAEGDLGVAFLLHRNCASKAPMSEKANTGAARLPRFYNPSFVPKADSSLEFCDLNDMDIVSGNEEKIFQSLERVFQSPRTRAVVIFTTCIMDLVGFDVQGLIRAANIHNKPFVMWRARVTGASTIPRLWEKLFSLAQPVAQPDPSLINLVGFAPKESLLGEELVQVLARLGLGVNSFVIPSCSAEGIENFNQAGAAILNAADVPEMEFSRARTRVGIPIVPLAPPFGPRRTLEFYLGILQATGREIDMTVMEAMWAPYSQEWERWRRRAERHRIGILVRSQDSEYLTNPMRLHGIDLPGFLVEMGFRVVVTALSQEEGMAPWFQELEQKIRERLASDRIVFEQAGAELDLPELVKQQRLSLVFSEYEDDGRVLAAGVNSFHTRHLDMGLAGAVHSVMTLVRLAESGFFRVFFEDEQ